MKSSRLMKFYPAVFITILVVVMVSLIAFTNNLTWPKIRVQVEQKTLELLREIFPETSYFVYNKNIGVYTTYDDSAYVVGYAFYGSSKGYRSDVVVLVGLKDRETIKDIIVVLHYEDWEYWMKLQRQNFFDQFINLKIEDCNLNEKGYEVNFKEVQNVTGATVSCNAVVDAVREAALEKVKFIEFIE